MNIPNDVRKWTTKNNWYFFMRDIYFFQESSIFVV